MRTIFACLAAILVLGSPVASIAEESEEPSMKAAVAVAQEWLSLIDQGQYAKSWDESSEYFRGVLRRDDWAHALEGIMKAFGKCLARKEALAKHVTSLPAAPDGEYVVVQYESSFERKKSAVETVTSKLDSDGKWRVAGYYIR